MEDYAGRILADRYRLPLPPSDEYELIETRAFDTRSGQEVLVRQVPLPEVVDAELLDGSRARPAGRGAAGELPAVRRAIAAAQAAASVPDHPRLDQVFDVFAEGGSLWIVSELVPARPLAALIADEPLSPYRAAEVAADVLTALRVLHAHGWTHRNITVRTVLVCDDGRVVLTGLAAGAAEEALCGYDPVPPDGSAGEPGPGPGPGDPWGTPPPAPGAGRVPPPGPPGPTAALDPGLPSGSGMGLNPGSDAGLDPGYGAEFGPGSDAGSDAAFNSGSGAGFEPGAGGGGYAPLVAPGYDTGPRYSDHITPGRAAEEPDAKAAARAGAIAAYRAGAQAAARKAQARPEGSNLPEGYSYPYGGPDTNAVQAALPWPGITPRDQPLPEPEPESAAESPPEPEPEALGRPALPAQLALPQGYRQAEADRSRPLPRAAEDGWGGGGPRTGLDAERARQTRMAVVGAVTERWAPEQARSVQGPWQLAAPVGPATDLWALGALLYRAVQGHAPYPEDSAAELVEMVCAEPPAFAEECGPLRPVVESLLRQDPTERPDFEELRGWLRSLVRSAPEPDGGTGIGMLPMPEADPAKLPVVRRRGDLHGRHRNPAAPRRRRPLGRTLLAGVLALLAGAVAYAMLFMPRSGGSEEPQNAGKPVPQQSSSRSAAPTKPQPQPQPEQSGGAPQSNPAPQTAPEGYTIQQDPEHFEIAAPKGWERHGVNEAGQVRYTDGAFTLTVVPGRDKVRGNPDPATYQKDTEPELNAYRNSTWTTSGDIKSTTVGQQLRVTGRYTWHDANGRSVFARNFVVALGNSYHVVMVTGPEDEQDKVTEVFEKATGSYKSGG
ncbi:Serine/threonine-protein kinase StkP [Streptomyces sp. ADI91-18]|uniref:protein kinase n=1 Tax=Streptomyces sp. ADI91-18 TaxID=1522755 RepID=UPI000F54DF21|nr:protein kinase [Streptomyces sp. ADI91-18]RPK46985.1 Serine/threonine-protein kinase StkP [Streptomyces sp. ADI91-18]